MTFGRLIRQMRPMPSDNDHFLVYVDVTTFDDNDPCLVSVSYFDHFLVYVDVA